MRRLASLLLAPLRLAPLLIAPLLIAPLLLSGCGKRGNPEPPGPAGQVTYPRTYPTY